MKFYAAAALLPLMLAPAVHAMEMASEMYVVGTMGRSNIGQSEMQVENNKLFENAQPIAGVGYNSSQDQTSRLGAKLQLGYQFSPNFAIEGGYVDLGKTRYMASNRAQTVVTSKKGPFGIVTKTNTSVPASSAVREYKITGWNIVGVGAYPVSTNLSLIGKLGLIRTEVKASGSGKAFGGGDLTVTKWKPTYGLGGDYKINEEIGIRAEFERFSSVGEPESTGSSNVNLFSLGVLGRF